MCSTVWTQCSSCVINISGVERSSWCLQAGILRESALRVCLFCENVLFKMVQSRASTLPFLCGETFTAILGLAGLKKLPSNRNRIKVQSCFHTTDERLKRIVEIKGTFSSPPRSNFLSSCWQQGRHHADERGSPQRMTIKGKFSGTWQPRG